MLTVWAFYWAYKNQLFTSTEALNQFLSSMGSAAPFGFIVIQIIQTVIPIIPGAITVPMGAIIFGPVYGLFLNVFAIIIGSILNFVLAKKYGQPFVERIIGEKKFARTVSWLDKDDKFEKWFTYAMFFPFSPDDILCYIAGLSKMSFKNISSSYYSGNLFQFYSILLEQCSSSNGYLFSWHSHTMLI